MSSVMEKQCGSIEGLHSGFKHRAGESIYGAAGAKIINVSH